MIIYLLLSYVFMLLVMLYKSLNGYSLKSWFKVWAFAPVTAPIYIIVNFLNW